LFHSSESWSGNRMRRGGHIVESGIDFGMLGAQPQIGRLYNQNDERPGFIDGAVLSDGFWRRAFGGHCPIPKHAVPAMDIATCA
jgi:hypothetical protein